MPFTAIYHRERYPCSPSFSPPSPLICLPHPLSNPPPYPPHSTSFPSIPTLLYPPSITPSPPGQSSSHPTSPATTSLFTLPHQFPPHHHNLSLATNLSSIPLPHRCH